MKRAAAVVVLAIVAATTLSAVGAPVGAVGAAGCAGPATHTEARPGPDGSAQLHGHLPIGRRSLARTGARVQLAPCGAAGGDRTSAAQSIAVVAGTDLRSTATRAVGDRAPPS